MLQSSNIEREAYWEPLKGFVEAVDCKLLFLKEVLQLAIPRVTMLK